MECHKYVQSTHENSNLFSYSYFVTCVVKQINKNKTKEKKQQEQTRCCYNFPSFKNKHSPNYPG